MEQRASPPRASSPKRIRASRPKASPHAASALKKIRAPSVNKKLTGTFTEGRPPWYDARGSIREPLTIGVAGGSGSGKTTVCEAIVKSVGIEWVALVHMDSFYRPLTEEEHERASRNEFNFDHPDAFDMPLLYQTVLDLKAGKSVNVPIYDFATHSRVKGSSKKVYGADVIIVEGIFVLLDDKLRKEFDIKLFVDTEDDTRLARRLRRDIIERGRNVIGVLAQYEKFVKPAFDDYILPTKSKADVIIPRGAENTVAINLIASHVQTKLIERGWKGADRKRLGKLGSPNVRVYSPNAQTDYIYTLLRDKNTSRDDFIFYANRMTRLLVEDALNHTPTTPRDIQTPTGSVYHGLNLHKNVCGVSVMRSGDSMTKALQEVVKEIEIGTILIQFDDQRVPRLFFYRLPENIQDCYVILLDPMVATGSTLLMALRLLLDHGVKEEKIIFVTLIACSVGLNAVSYAYPHVQILAGAVDDELTKDGKILPGLGHFGDRYFGTEVETFDDDSVSESFESFTPGTTPVEGRDDLMMERNRQNSNLFKSV